MALEFNNYNIDVKIKDILLNLNEDFNKLKDGGSSSGGVSIEVGLPIPSLSYRGKIIYITNASGVSDDVYICKKIADNSFVWVQIG
jgi:hypothetical protein